MEGKEIEKERNCKTIIRMLMEKGAKPAPESYQRERYSNKWNTVKTYSLGDEPPKRIQLPKSDEPYYFYKSFRFRESEKHFPPPQNALYRAPEGTQERVKL